MQGMLQTLFPPVLGLLASAEGDVALAAVPLLGSYVNKLKLGLKRSNNVLPEVRMGAQQAGDQAMPLHKACAWAWYCSQDLVVPPQLGHPACRAFASQLAVSACGCADTSPAAGSHHAQHHGICTVRRGPGD